MYVLNLSRARRDTREKQEQPTPATSQKGQMLTRFTVLCYEGQASKQSSSLMS